MLSPNGSAPHGDKSPCYEQRRLKTAISWSPDIRSPNGGRHPCHGLHHARVAAGHAAPRSVIVPAMAESTDFHAEDAVGKVYDSRLMRRLLAYVAPYKGMAAGAVK